MRQIFWRAGVVLLIVQSFGTRPAFAETLPTFTFYGIGTFADDPMPVMVTYELKRQREAARIIASNPKAFWIRQIMTRIEASKLEPPKTLKEDTTVRLSFVVARDGHVVSKEVRTSSGSAVADKAALVMLEHAQPFPPMPQAMSDQDLSFNLPIRFR